MDDYFDRFEQELRDAAVARRHLPWHRRVRVPLRGRALLLALLGVVVVATPAVGAAVGWFSPGAPDAGYPASPSSELGTVLPHGDRLLPIRVADPDGGPPWGVRLVRTTRGDTCIQVGRVEDGQIGSLGIDGAWHDDHEFHAIRPNDELADICGATDAAGMGYTNETVHGAPASVAVSLYGRTHPNQTGERMIFAGLLGPDARRITYRTPSGQVRHEATSGGVGAYLIVFRQTARNCGDFTQTLMGGARPGCESDGTAGGAALRGPTAVTSVRYANGRTCSVEPSARLATAYRALMERLRARERAGTLSPAADRASIGRFFSAFGIPLEDRIEALMPECKPVGWVNAPSSTPITAADVAAPLKVSITEGRRFCSPKGPWGQQSVHDDTVVCPGRVPKGDDAYWETPNDAKGPLFALIRVSFTAREPVTGSTSFYHWQIKAPGNRGGEGNETQANVRRGETIVFTMKEPIPGTGHFTNPSGQTIAYDVPRGVYHGTIQFEPNLGTAGLNGAETGGVTVGRFSFRLPLPKRR